MRGSTIAAVLPGVFVVALLALAPVLSQETPEGKAQSPAEVSAPEGGNIPMARIVMGRKHITGRIVFENNKIIRIEHVDGGVAGYEKQKVKEIQRDSLDPAIYYEQVGDFYASRLWDLLDDLNDFAQAHQAYRRALSHETSQETRDRILKKNERLNLERQQWHHEELRRIAVRKAQEEAELVRVQRQLVEKQLQTAGETARSLERLQGRVAALEAHLRDMARRHGHLREIVDDLDDAVDDLRRRRRYYVTHSLYLDLRRKVMEIQRQVTSLENRAKAR